jgi:peptidoglycan hydrolase-like protein with peptidoglycan-binding domain
MVPYRSTVLLVTCASCLGFAPSPAKGFIHPNQTGEISITPLITGAGVQNSLQVAQANAPAGTQRPPLGPGDQQPAVRELQKTLKTLGYYNGAEDGVYEATTAAAVAQFQAGAGLEADGVVGSTTWDRLQLAQNQAKPAPSPEAQKASNSKSNVSRLLHGKTKWVLLGLGVILVAGIVGGILNLLMRSGEDEEDLDPDSRRERSSQHPQQDYSETPHSLQNRETNLGSHQPNFDNNGYPVSGALDSEKKERKQPADSTTPEFLAVEEITRLQKIDIIDELIRDLQKPDPAKRRKAIWDLGQRGDSRAVQPLVNLLVDSDSKQRSLILAALSEIGTRTLKPMNRALAVSLQDDNAEVRKNAIRDLTRIYELVSQMSQLLGHAIDDPDDEVRETANWALAQLSSIRGLPSGENRPSRSNSANPPEDSTGEF